MKLLTRNTDYAVRAICCMASKPGQINTVKKLASELKMPRPFLRKILQRLNKVGLVRSTKGSGGGFRLSVAPDKLTLADLIMAFQGPLSINECTLKKKACPNRRGCPLKSRIEEIEERMAAELKATSIGSLLTKGA